MIEVKLLRQHHMQKSVAKFTDKMPVHRRAKCLYCPTRVTHSNHKRHEISHLISYSCTQCNNDILFKTTRQALTHERQTGHITHACTHAPRPLHARSGAVIPLRPRWRQGREFRVRLTPPPQLSSESESDCDSSISSAVDNTTSTTEETTLTEPDRKSVV